MPDKSEIGKSKTEKKKKSKIEPFMIIGTVGVIILFIGGFFITLAYTLPSPNSWEYDDGDEWDSDYGNEYDAAYHSYIKRTEIMLLIGAVIMDIGMLLLLLMSFLPLFSPKVSDEDKRSFLIIGIALIFIFIYQLKVGTLGLFSFLF